MLSNRFRWVYCKLDVLRQCHRNDLRRILKELPQSLDETYQRILKEINDAYRKEAHRLFQCLVVAQRPLRVEELAEVLALDVDAGGIPRFNAKRRRENHEAAVLSICSSLVSVVDHDGSRVVQFCHFSVKEFLMSDRLSSTEDISQFHISREPSHLILAQACLSVFLSVDDRTSEDSAGDNPLSKYASEHWLEHALVGEVELHIADALDCLFDRDKPHFEALLRRAGMSRELRFSDKDPRLMLTPAFPLSVAAKFGLSGLAKRLIVANPQVTGYRFYGCTLLHLAVRDEETEVARLLLAHGADINSRQDYPTPPHITPPHIASPQHHSERLLDGSLDGSEEIENSLQNSSEESRNYYMSCGKEWGFTPLHLAVSHGNLGLSQMLLEHEADVRMYDNSGDTPLHLAASVCHLEISRILLEYNAEVNSRNNDGSTPLLIASSKGNLDILRLLLAHGADAFAHDYSGSTPLHFAVIGAHLEVACMLLERKADSNALNDEGSTPLHQASQSWWRGDPDIVQLVRLLLDNGEDVNVHDKRGNTPLHFAASGGNLEVARMLLEFKAETNFRNEDGYTPLLIASSKGNLDILRLLLAHGMDVSVRDNSGNTPLHLAAIGGHLEVARSLLEHKADVNALDDKGSTPLHQASSWWREYPDIVLQLVRLLLDNGVNVNVHDKRGNTPLHFAASGGDLEVARMLLEFKAEANSRNEDGYTPLLIASSKGNLDILRVLLAHEADAFVHDNSGSTPLHLAAIGGHLEVARSLLEHKADVNALDDKGSTPLHQASQSWWRGDPDIVQLVRLLLDNDVNVNVHDKHGNTPLHFAASVGHLKVARMLLEFKAEVDSLNKARLTPLQLTLKGRRNGYRDIMRLLLHHGANVNVQDKRD
jgi:ankyrin repeat protein